MKADGESTDAIAEKVDLNRNSVQLCMKKYKEGGVENAIFDAPGRGRNAEITVEEKSQIINIACQRPGDFGYVSETWTYVKLTEHNNKNAEGAGYTRLSINTKASIKNTLSCSDIIFIVVINQYVLLSFFISETAQSTALFHQNSHPITNHLIGSI